MTRRLLIRNGWIVSMDPEVGEIAGGSILVEDSKITQVASDIEAPENTEVIDATGMIVHPGLVDTHKHLWQAGLRGAAQDSTLVGYMHDVRQFYLSRFRPEDVEIANYAGALELIDAGTTTVLDFSHGVVTPAHGEALVEAEKRSGIRGVWAYGYCPVEVEGRDQFGSHKARIKEAYRLKDAHFSSDDALLRMGVSITEQNLLPFDLTVNEIQSARDMDILWTGHVHCGPGNTRVTRGFHQLVAKGLVDHRTVLSHLNEFGVDDFEIVADLGAHFSTTPDAEIAGGMNFPAPLRNALLGGVQPTLGTDCVVGSQTSMYSLMRTGLMFARYQFNQGPSTNFELVAEQRVSSRDVLRWATVEGAKALGLEDQIGSISPGKRADLVLVDARTLNMAPILDPVASLVGHAHTGNVDTVIIDGVVRKRHGKLVDVDVSRVLADLEASKNHLTGGKLRITSADQLGGVTGDWSESLSSIS
ncbi:amidohydrolase family protein [Nocardia sp. R6R-6]|uniref:amidohydrolase family protein n=1 Tax=Nocardia sp. R6R-6 TaxID=3459303 RepID=UPI00403DBDBC